MLSYKSFDVIDEQIDARDGGPDDTQELRSGVLRSPVGIAIDGVSEKYPRIVRPYRWTCKTFAEVAALRAFLTARKGQAIPFWMLTWEKDIELTTAPGFATSYTIKWIGYTANLFPGTGARRHVWIHHPTAGLFFVTVISSVDNGDGTETLTMQAGAGANVQASSFWTLGFLRFVRLADDENSIEWGARNYASMLFRTIEVPNEAPLV